MLLRKSSRRVPLFLAAMLLAILGSARPIFADPDDAQMPKITPEETHAYLAAHRAEWAARVHPGQGRLFFTPAEWDALVTRVNAATGKSAELKKLLFEEADKVCSDPIQKYHPPDPKDINYLEEGWERGFGSRMVVLAFAAKLSPEPRYKQRLHDMVMAGCDFETWGHSGKAGEQSNMDLAAGSMSKGVSMAYDWHRDIFSEPERAHIREVMAKRMHDMLRGLYGAIFWSNWYSQNHNHVAVAGLGLAGLAFLDEIPEAPEWLAGAVLNFQRVGTAMAGDGSSYEGVGYWGYGRAHIVEFIEGTKSVTESGKLYDLLAFRNAAAFRVDTATPDLRGVLMWSDTRGFDVDGPHQILYRLAAQYRDGQAQWLADHLPAPPTGAGNSAWALVWRDPSLPPVAPTALDAFFPDWDVVTSRSGWGAGDYLFSLKSGLVNDHHTHPDAGAITFCVGGDWLLEAAGYGLGMGKLGFFERSGKRYEYQSNATESESTLLINGKNQRLDAKARGTVDHYVSAPGSVWTEVDLSQAYQDVQAVRRRVWHRRGKYILVLDEVRADAPVTVEWLAQVPPRARYEGAQLSVDGGAGVLRMEMLGANASPWAVRRPGSAILDVSDKRLLTLASRQSGGDVHFAALLLPRLPGDAAPAPNGSFHVMKENTLTWVKGTNWVDEIFTLREVGSMDFTGFDGQLNSATAKAVFSAVGWTEGKVTSLTLGGVVSARVEPLNFRAERPVDFSLERSPRGDFVFDLGTPLTGTLELAAGYALRTEAGAPVNVAPAKATTLDKGRYFLVRDDAGLVETQKWIADLFPARPDPRHYPLIRSAVLPPAPAGTRVAWEAEDAPVLRYDYASVADNATASGGKALMSFGIDSPSDSVAWKISVPVAGSYFLKAQYSTNQHEVGVKLLVDGSLPSPAAANAMWIGNPGPPAEKYFTPATTAWQTHLLTAGGSDVPLAIPLSAGEHDIRLADPTQPINFDSFELTPAVR